MGDGAVAVAAVEKAGKGIEEFADEAFGVVDVGE